MHTHRRRRKRVHRPFVATPVDHPSLLPVQVKLQRVQLKEDSFHSGSACWINADELLTTTSSDIANSSIENGTNASMKHSSLQVIRKMAKRENVIITHSHSSTPLKIPSNCENSIDVNTFNNENVDTEASASVTEYMVVTDGDSSTTLPTMNENSVDFIDVGIADVVTNANIGTSVGSSALEMLVDVCHPRKNSLMRRKVAHVKKKFKKRLGNTSINDQLISKKPSDINLSIPKIFSIVSEIDFSSKTWTTINNNKVSEKTCFNKLIANIFDRGSKMKSMTKTVVNVANSANTSTAFKQTDTSRYSEDSKLREDIIKWWSSRKTKAIVPDSSTREIPSNAADSNNNTKISENQSVKNSNATNASFDDLSAVETFSERSINLRTTVSLANTFNNTAYQSITEVTSSTLDQLSLPIEDEGEDFSLSLSYTDDSSESCLAMNNIDSNSNSQHTNETESCSVINNIIDASTNTDTINLSESSENCCALKDNIINMGMNTCQCFSGTSNIGSRDDINNNDQFQRCSFLNDLRKRNELCDVTLVAQDGIEIPAHKVILCGISQYFYSKYCSINTSNNDRIELNDIDAVTLESIVNFAYTSEIEITEHNVKMLSKAADILFIRRLKSKCADILSNLLNLSNFFEIRSVAQICSYKTLSDVCETFMWMNFTKLIKMNQFWKLEANELSKIIQSDNLCVKSEEKVYDSVVRWVKFDIENRMKYLPDLIQYVRFQFMSTDLLIQLVYTESLLKDCAHVQRILAEAFLNDHVHIPETEQSNIQNIPRKCYAKSAPIKNTIFVIGGLINNRATSSVEYFDLKRRRWNSASSMPSDKYGSAAALVGHEIYVIGGRDSNNKFTSDVFIYDIRTDNWSNGTPMLDNRAFHSAVVWKDRIYVIGGIYQDTKFGYQVHKAIQYFCLKLRHWFYLEMEDNNAERRAYLCTAVIEDRIYAIGGCTDCNGNKHKRNFKSVECFDPNSRRWIRVPAMNFNRSGAAAVVINHKLYVIGGVGHEEAGQQIEMYNAKENEWHSVHQMPVFRTFTGACTEQGCIYVVGGCDSEKKPLSTVDVYYAKSDRWITLKQEMLTPHYCHCVIMAHKT